MRSRPYVRRHAGAAWAALAVAAWVAVAAAVAASAASAQPPPPRRGLGPGPWASARGGARRHELGGRFLAALDAVDLSEAQKTKLREIRRRAPAALMPKKQAVIEARMDLHDLLQQDKVDPNEARKAHEKLLRARDELATAAFDLRLQAREVLTPEQRKKLQQGMHSGPGWWRGEMEHGRGE